MTPLSQFALLDVVVAGYKWTAAPTSNSGTQLPPWRLCSNNLKTHLVLAEIHVLITLREWVNGRNLHHRRPFPERETYGMSGTHLRGLAAIRGGGGEAGFQVNGLAHGIILLGLQSVIDPCADFPQQAETQELQTGHQQEDA